MKQELFKKRVQAYACNVSKRFLTKYVRYKTLNACEDISNNFTGGDAFLDMQLVMHYTKKEWANLYKRCKTFENWFKFEILS